LAHIYISEYFSDLILYKHFRFCEVRHSISGVIVLTVFYATVKTSAQHVTHTMLLT